MAAARSEIVLLLIDFLAIERTVPKIPQIKIDRAFPHGVPYITILVNK